MKSTIQHRADSIEPLVDSLNILGFYARQYCAEVIVKTEKGGAYGFSIIFGVEKTYINDFKSSLKVIPTQAQQVLAILSRIAPRDIAKELSKIPSSEVLSSQDIEVSRDIDGLKKCFSPEIPPNMLLAYAVEQQLHCFPTHNGVVIHSRSDSAVLVGSIYVSDNLWYLSLPSGFDMRVNELALFDLVNELENLCEQHGNQVNSILAHAYGC